MVPFYAKMILKMSRGFKARATDTPHPVQTKSEYPLVTSCLAGWQFWWLQLLFFTQQYGCASYFATNTRNPLDIGVGYFCISSVVLYHNPPLPGLLDHAFNTCLEPLWNRSQHKTDGASVHKNSSMIQLLMYGVITTLANRTVPCLCS